MINSLFLDCAKNIHLTNKSMDLSGNLDCSFYTDFPSHLITSEFFIYNYEDDMHNYEQNKREGTEDNEDIDMDHNKNVDMERMHSMNSSGNIIINSSSINIEKNITNEENIETKKYQKETWKDYINNSFDENKIDDEIKLKVPNIGFISLKMDIKLFNACKDFSELIQISSRISHIIVSFRDFLKNSLILHRIKTRRMF